MAASVIIATYNRACVLARAVSSVLRAIRPGDEVIVVDDGSTDSTEATLAKHAGRIRYLKVKHGGAGAARNRGVREASNDLIAFLDSDDEWLPGQLELQRRILGARPELVFSFGNLVNETLDVPRDQRVLEVWRNGTPGWEEVMGPPRRYSRLAALPDGFEDFQVYTGNLYRWELTNPYFSTISLVFRRDRCREIPRFDERLAIYEDWVFCGEIARAGSAAYLDIATAIQHKDCSARLTDADLVASAAAALDVLPGIWGRDEDFLREHRALYERTLQSWRTRMVKGLVTAGQIEEARAQLRRMRDVRLPWRHRILLALPRSVARQAVRVVQGARREQQEQRRKKEQTNGKVAAAGVEQA